MKNIEDISNSIFSTKMPYVLWITITYISAVILQFTYYPMLLESFIVGCFMLQHISLYWKSDELIERRPIFYFIGQTMIVFAAAFILEKGSMAILIGLLPLLISQSLIIFQKKLQVILISIFLYSQYIVALYLNYGVEHMLLYVFVFMLILSIVLYYYTVYVGQIRLRKRTQYYLEELELAHKKVEELTLANERQRMARDLHDTFAQGLAALVMQLEAVDVYLDKGNIDKSKEIIQNSLVNARKTLKEARLVIDDLRENTEKNLDMKDSVDKLIVEFEKDTSIIVRADIQRVMEISNFVKEHTIYIISECLVNIRKHAEATEVTIQIIEFAEQMIITLEDNGIGFENANIQSGKYGLLGMKERVRMINGNIEINSNVGEGTQITISIPM